ncbi:single-strand binding family protein [Limosilactobacillus coleohominis 101-4-CHN]|uniref:Single-stranded DNA-binding protein n=1 Tax=Limosilactobacillus coleohominis 101-4-CHN TaxID=575594 RepID=C7XUW1_9LACO|nr:single-stranded DNA-binding protein [Limosilactobacillus coleohominis]EEU31072.1 single-strand binding family protein [Limosilactobacillus coleohominis 101-4-CHN]
MINRTVLTGRLTDDPELRYTNQGTAVVAFRLAVNRQFRNQDGSRDADFINCVVWRKSAENFANFMHKGSLVGIDGRLSTRNYENKQGQKVYVTEVTVENFALLESRKNNQENYNDQQDNYNNNVNQSASNQQGENVDLSTLPFNNDEINGSAADTDDVPF